VQNIGLSRYRLPRKTHVHLRSRDGIVRPSLDTAVRWPISRIMTEQHGRRQDSDIRGQQRGRGEGTGGQ